jgi:thymidylate synthase (FAD)
LFPLVWEAFVDYRVQGLFLTRLDREVIVRLVSRLAAAGRAQATEEDFLAAQDPSWVSVARSRERDECREKLRQLNLLS